MTPASELSLAIKLYSKAVPPFIRGNIEVPLDLAFPPPVLSLLCIHTHISLLCIFHCCHISLLCIRIYMYSEEPVGTAHQMVEYCAKTLRVRGRSYRNSTPLLVMRCKCNFHIDRDETARNIQCRCSLQCKPSSPTANALSSGNCGNCVQCLSQHYLRMEVNLSALRPACNPTMPWYAVVVLSAQQKDVGAQQKYV